MGFGSMGSYKRWAFPIQPSAPKQPPRHPTALMGREALFEPGRSTHHLVLEGGEVYRDAPKACTYSSGAAHNMKSSKEIDDLEKVRLKLEGEIGHSASYARWAKASGIDQKTLQKRLQFGWYCRDKLIKSTNSLVMYLARNNRGMGIAFDDLLQITMERFIKRIQTARRTFYDGEGKYPEDDEMAELTGLSLANVRVARRCTRVVGSLDKEIVNGWRLKYTV